MRDLIRAPVRVADDEAFDRYVEERSTSTVNYIVVRKGWIEKYAISSDGKEVDEWAKANASKIMVPVRHILVKGDKDKPEELEDARRRRPRASSSASRRAKTSRSSRRSSRTIPAARTRAASTPASMVEHFVPEFKKSVDGLKPGELDQKLVQTSFGYHIIKRDPATQGRHRQGATRRRSPTTSRRRWRRTSPPT